MCSVYCCLVHIQGMLAGTSSSQVWVLQAPSSKLHSPPLAATPFPEFFFTEHVLLYPSSSIHRTVSFLIKIVFYNLNFAFIFIFIFIYFLTIIFKDVTTE